MLNLNHTNSDRQFFSVEETSNLLNLNITQIRRMIKQGGLVANRVGNVLWVTKSSIEKAQVKKVDE